MTAASLRALAVLVAVSLVACRPFHAPTSDAPRDRLAALERARDGRTASRRDLAELAALTWLTTGSLDRTQAALAARPDLVSTDELAALVALFVARERLREDEAVDAALTLVHSFPRSPYAEVAAGRLEEFSGISPAVDARLEAALAPLDRESLGLGAHAAFRARRALVAVREARQDDAGAAHAREASGAATAWTLVGPLGLQRLGAAGSASELDRGGPLAPSYAGPLGPVAPRAWSTPSGQLSVRADPWQADLYEALADVGVEEGGEHLVAFAGVGEARVWVDGVPVLARTAHPRRAPERSWAMVRLGAGSHRVRVRFTRTDGDAFSLALPRADGRPARLVWSAPRVGAPEPRGAVAVTEPPADARRALEARLADGRGGAAEAWARILAAVPDDGAAARARLAAFAAQVGETPSLRALRLDLTAWDPELPEDVQRLVAARETEAIVAAEPGWARAWLAVFDRQRGEKRSDDARATLDRLAVLSRGAPATLARVEVLRARLLHDLGDAEGARRALARALELDPGRCDAADLGLAQARREDDVRTAEALSSELAGCGGGDGARLALARSRGRWEEAQRLADRIVARDPMAPAHREALAEVQVATGDFDGARRWLETVAEAWPHRAEAWRQLARIEELRGHRDQARLARRRAAALDASDLATMRLVALDAGGELLGWAARDGSKAIRDYLSSGVHSTSHAVQVLDLAASEWQPDGSVLARVHVIVRVLDKRGIDQFGEVTLPEDAQALVVRTVKPDGTALEAERIDGKASVSLPNLEPGDFVEYAYVRAAGPRAGPMRGFSAGQFLFASSGLPVFESVHVVRTPAAAPPPEWDAHRLDGAQGPVRKGEAWEWSHTYRGMEPHVREPLAPSDAELLPWAEVGTGASTADAMAAIGEWVSLRTRPDPAVDAFVAGCLALPARERVAEVVRRLRASVKGAHDARDLSGPAAVLSRGRGNRLVPLLAALEACRVPAHLVAARPFGANPHPFRFPHPEVYATWLVRAAPDGGPEVWIDPAARDVPVGVLEPSLSEADAFVVPRPGEAAVRVRLPSVDPWQHRAADRYELEISDDGAMRGTLVRTAHGAAAGWFRRFLEETAPDDLRKAEEQRLAAVFRGVAVSEVAPVLDDDLSHASMRVAFATPTTSPDGRREWPASPSADRLAHRLLSRGERRMPLVIGDDEAAASTTRVRLPPGTKARLPQEVALDTPFGRYSLRWREEGDGLVGEESLLVRHQRVTPERYADFARFVAAVDQARAATIAVSAPP